jgi:hypothetical protein
LRVKLPTTPIVVIRPGIQAKNRESAESLTADGASSAVFTLEDAHLKVHSSSSAPPPPPTAAPTPVAMTPVASSR